MIVSTWNESQPPGGVLGGQAHDQGADTGRDGRGGLPDRLARPTAADELAMAAKAPCPTRQSARLRRSTGCGWCGRCGLGLGHSGVAHRDCHTDPVISPGLTWATATGWDTVEDWVGARLSSRWGAAEGADFDQEGLCAEVREVVNDNLPAGWTLEENQFVGPTPIPEDAPDIIRDTIDEIDFWGMAQYYDNGD